jgi:hypothetical protein
MGLLQQQLEQEGQLELEVLLEVLSRVPWQQG